MFVLHLWIQQRENELVLAVEAAESIDWIQIVIVKVLHNRCHDLQHLLVWGKSHLGIVQWPSVRSLSGPVVGLAEIDEQRALQRLDAGSPHLVGEILEIYEFVLVYL